MSGLVVKNNNELWFNTNKLSTSTGTKGLYMDNNRNLFFNDVKIASGNLNNALGLHLINSELAYDGIKFGSELNVLIRSLFANNEQGFAFDFNDLSTMYQDSAGTIPVTGVGQPVGKVLDKSGRGNHATQSTSAKRPILQQNVATGAYYLAFDGVDDFLVTGSIDLRQFNQLSIFSGLTKLADDAPKAIFSYGGVSGTNGAIACWVGGNIGLESYTTKAGGFNYNNILKSDKPQLIAPHTAVFSYTSNFINGIDRYAINRANIAQTTKTGSQTEFFGAFSLNIGSNNGSMFFNGNIYSLIGIARLATSTEITNAENAIAKNVGVTL